MTRCAGCWTSSLDLPGDGGAQWPTVVPLELEAGLVYARPWLRIMLGYAKDHMRSAEEDMKADHRCPPSRSTLERVAKAMGRRSRGWRHTSSAGGGQAERVPDGAVAIVLGLDRTAVPMEEDLADGTPMPRRTRPYSNRVIHERGDGATALQNCYAPRAPPPWGSSRTAPPSCG